MIGSTHSVYDPEHFAGGGSRPKNVETACL